MPGGTPFDALVRQLRQKGVDNPEGLAASIGRKKYGKKKFAEMSARGRKEKAAKKSTKKEAKDS